MTWLAQSLITHPDILSGPAALHRLTLDRVLLMLGSNRVPAPWGEWSYKQVYNASNCALITHCEALSSSI